MSRFVDVLTADGLPGRGVRRRHHRPRRPAPRHRRGHERHQRHGDDARPPSPASPRGRRRIRNVAHIRHKETDRIAALATELRRLGAEVEEFADGLHDHPAAAARGEVRDLQRPPHGDEPGAGRAEGAGRGHRQPRVRGQDVPGVLARPGSAARPLGLLRLGPERAEGVDLGEDLVAGLALGLGQPAASASASSPCGDTAGPVRFDAPP